MAVAIAVPEKRAELRARRSLLRGEARLLAARALRAPALLAVALAAAAALVADAPRIAGAAGPVDSGERFEMAAPLAPGPAEYNRVWVRKYGPQDAEHILVLMSGSPSSQGTFDFLARLLMTRVPNLAIWTVDRRDNGLEDVSGFLVGDPDLALGYYYGGLEVNGRTFDPIDDDEAPWAYDWGIQVVLEDVRQVVLAASDGGRRGVILGGHSMGAMTTPTYAAWDFDGTPGYRDLEGLVLIDGGQFGAFAKYLVDTPFQNPWTTVAEANAGLAYFRSQSPFGVAGTDLMGLPLWVVGVLPELACQYAVTEPQAESALQLSAFLLSGLLLPAIPVTNEAFFGYFVRDGGFDALEAKIGRLAATGLPRPWRNGPTSNVRTMCSTFVSEVGNAMAWYYPVRIDVDLLLAVPELERTEVTDALGLRPWHLAEIDLPLYVFESGISQGGVLRSAHELIARSRIQQATLAEDQTLGHYDPLVDFPVRNRFLDTLVPFLRGITARRPG